VFLSFVRPTARPAPRLQHLTRHRTRHLSHQLCYHLRRRARKLLLSGPQMRPLVCQRRPCRPRPQHRYLRLCPLTVRPVQPVRYSILVLMILSALRPRLPAPFMFTIYWAAFRAMNSVLLVTSTASAVTSKAQYAIDAAISLEMSSPWSVRCRRSHVMFAFVADARPHLPQLQGQPQFRPPSQAHIQLRDPPIFLHVRQHLLRHPTQQKFQQPTHLSVRVLYQLTFPHKDPLRCHQSRLQCVLHTTRALLPQPSRHQRRRRWPPWRRRLRQAQRFPPRLFVPCTVTMHLPAELSLHILVAPIGPHQCAPHTVGHARKHQVHNPLQSRRFHQQPGPRPCRH